MERDNKIFELIENEHQRQLKGIELIASENFVSDQVMEASIRRNSSASRRTAPPTARTSSRNC